MSDTTSVYQAYQGNTYLFGGNAPYVEVRKLPRQPG
jgi:2-oxoglutarate dehydrogenase E1 component